jgi:hypothetical protein
MHIKENIDSDLTSGDALIQEHLGQEEEMDMSEDFTSSNKSLSSLASGSMKLVEGKNSFAPSATTRKRKVDALEWDDVLPPERPGIGDSIREFQPADAVGACRDPESLQPREGIGCEPGALLICGDENGETQFIKLAE